jgi:2,4-dienoyl-CoA reductase-like NADH-dependent reductase (Old Yellow Enzyme family)
MTDPVEALQRRVEAYLKRNKMTATAFGKAALKNPSLVRRIRSGAIGMVTIRKVSAYLERAAK